ncbi:MAG: tRNA lysidine(34) synthetase TilS [Desulfovibrio sp.]|jgi:tRNA(Ile)-lysidine synthase|nr:tRNA lysidine(34) synthetase TilS [Desulfovibrio sp.]
MPGDLPDLPGDLPDLPADLRDLPAREAHFCLNILRFMENIPGLRLGAKRLLVAFSGGADSTALLLVLSLLRRKAGFTLLAAHLDHMLRPSSAAEAEYCRRFCAHAGIACHVGRQDVGGGEAGDGGSGGLGKKAGAARGLEEKARAARYAFLAGAAAESGADIIALGHNNNDLAEDVLMRLIRGAGWPGLAGMRASDAERSLVRPLLYTPRADIENFLKTLGIRALHDESNTDRRFFRNRVRMDILPLPTAENPAFLRAITALHMQGEVDREYFAALTAAAAADVLPSAPAGSRRSPGRQSSPDAAGPAGPPEPSAASVRPAAGSEGIFIERRRLEALPKAVRLRLYKRILDALGPGQARFFSLAALDAPLQAGRGPATHRFPGGKSAVAGHKGILFSKSEAKTSS